MHVVRSNPQIDLGLLSLLAIPLWITGGGIILWCFWSFSFQGYGTPNPLDPPKVLVANGLYRYVRNPIYVGTMLFVAGHLIWFGSLALIPYLLVMFLFFHLYVVYYEEPNLSRRFGEKYEQYQRQVPRWIPKLKTAGD